jgi:outer membrane lipoprotein-sorting protein
MKSMSPTFGGWRRLALVLVVVTALVAVAGAAATDDRPSGDAVFEDTRDRYANAESLVTTANVTVSNDSANASVTVEFAAAGNQSRAVVRTDNATYRSGANETVRWYVGPNRSVAYDRDAVARPDGGTTTLDTLENGSVDDWENVSVEYLRAGSDDGTDAHVIEVTHDGDGERSTATLWVAQSDSRLLRAETGDGTNRTVVDYRETTFNASVHESTFDPPADRLTVTSVASYDTFEATQANTSIDLPTLDATFREASVLTASSGTTVAQTYRAEGDNVTVVSTTSDRRFDRSENATTVTVDGHDANVTTVDDRAVVYWERDDVATAVVVDADEDRAVELARRLE